VVEPAAAPEPFNDAFNFIGDAPGRRVTVGDVGLGFGVEDAPPIDKSGGGASCTTGVGDLAASPAAFGSGSAGSDVKEVRRGRSSAPEPVSMASRLPERRCA
jgi:hypothetical protein